MAAAVFASRSYSRSAAWWAHRAAAKDVRTGVLDGLESCRGHRSTMEDADPGRDAEAAAAARSVRSARSAAVAAAVRARRPWEEAEEEAGRLVAPAISSVCATGFEPGGGA